MKFENFNLYKLNKREVTYSIVTLKFYTIMSICMKDKIMMLAKNLRRRWLILFWYIIFVKVLHFFIILSHNKYSPKRSIRYTNRYFLVKIYITIYFSIVKMYIIIYSSIYKTVLLPLTTNTDTELHRIAQLSSVQSTYSHFDCQIPRLSLHKFYLYFIIIEII